MPLNRRSTLKFWAASLVATGVLPAGVAEAALEARAREFGGDGAVSPLAPLTHTFTHFRLDIEPRLAELGRAAGGSAALGDAETVWVALRDIDAYGVPAPVRKLLDGLQGSLL